MSKATAVATHFMLLRTASRRLMHRFRRRIMFLLVAWKHNNRRTYLLCN